MRFLLLLVFGCLITQSNCWFADDLLQGAGNLVNAGLGAAGNIITGTGDLLGGAVEGIGHVGGEILEGVGHVGGEILEGIGQAGGEVLEGIGQVGGGLLGLGAGVVEAGKDIFGNVVGTALNIGGNVVGNVADATVNLWCATVGQIVPCREVSGHGSVAPLPFQCRGKADIIFVVDASGSVGSYNFKRLLSFAANLAGSYLIGPANTRFGLVVFSNNYQKWFDLKTYSTPLDVFKAILATPYSAGATYTDKALNSVITNRMFDSINGGRSDAKDVVITLTDGQSNNPTATAAAANALKAKGVILASLGIGSFWGSNKGELLTLASSPELAFRINDFDQLGSFLYQIAQKTCAISGGVEKPVVVEPPIVEVKPACDAQADILFLIDSSGSIGPKNYWKVLNFTVDLVNQFKIGKNAVLFGSVIFSTNAQKGFDLKDNPTKAALRRAVYSSPYHNATTNTDKAFDLVREESMFSRSAGGRDGAQNVVILITDGQSDNPRKTVAAADKLKDQEDAIIIALGVNKANRQELEDVASSSDDVLYVNNFDALKNIKSKVVSRACENSKKK